MEYVSEWVTVIMWTLRNNLEWLEQLQKVAGTIYCKSCPGGGGTFHPQVRRFVVIFFYIYSQNDLQANKSWSEMAKVAVTRFGVKSQSHFCLHGCRTWNMEMLIAGFVCHKMLICELRQRYRPCSFPPLIAQSEAKWIWNQGAWTLTFSAGSLYLDRWHFGKPELRQERRNLVEFWEFH